MLLAKNESLEAKKKKLEERLRKPLSPEVQVENGGRGPVVEAESEVPDSVVRRALMGAEHEEPEELLSPAVSLPDGNGELQYFSSYFFLQFAKKVSLEISLSSIRNSGHHVSFSMSFSPVPEWISSLSYILSSPSEPRTPNDASVKKRPRSADKGVGTSGVRRSDRILQKLLQESKSGTSI